MSTYGIEWQPTDFSTIICDRVVRDNLSKIFGTLTREPREFTGADVVKLAVLSDIHGGDGNPYDSLIEAIYKHGTILVRLAL